MSKIIVIGSQKGGVGKTTTTFNLAYILSRMGKKVLAVDFDSQANLTTCYGIEKTDELEYTIGLNLKRKSNMFNFSYKHWRRQIFLV